MEDKALVAHTGNGSMFLDPQTFEHAQRVANVFAKSTMVPDHFKNNIGNCLIAMNYANRMDADIFMVMQNMYIVHGRPGIESKLAIALLNSSGRFTPLRFRYNEGKTECVALAKDRASGEICEGPVVSIEMAKKEKWLDKNGSKWKTLPDLMLMYRSAMFFIRMYAPEVLLGMQSREELQDVAELRKSGDGSYAVDPTPHDSAEDLADTLGQSAPVAETPKDPPPEEMKKALTEADPAALDEALMACEMSNMPTGDKAVKQVYEALKA